jgi:hypothetical protein
MLLMIMAIDYMVSTENIHEWNSLEIEFFAEYLFIHIPSTPETLSLLALSIFYIRFENSMPYEQS